MERTVVDEVTVQVYDADDDPQQQLQREAEGFMSNVACLGTDGINRVLDHWQHEAKQMLESLYFSSESPAENGRVASRRVVRVKLEWRELTYRVAMGRRRRRKWRTVLQSSSAAVPPGRLLAVLGPTFCGKTSLLNALSARLPMGGNLTGEVLVNGLPRGKGFRTITAYVQQDDVLFHNLTVRETFEFAAAMCLPGSVPAAAKRHLAARVISELGLAKVENTYVGNAFVQGISGGERKRCNIGIQILRNPSLIFLDEPTSGLDAFQAQKVMEALWGLAHSGRSVVATVHQPRSSIYQMFDLLLLLSEGKTMYFGQAAKAVAYFKDCGFPCPPHYNPADFFLDVISMDFRSKELEEGAGRRVDLVARAFERRGAGEVERAGVQAGDTGGAEESAVTDAQTMKELNRHPGFPNTFPAEFGLLLKRAWKQQSRDRLPQMISIIQTIVIGFVLAALYSGLDKSQTGIQDEIGILFFTSIFCAFNALFGAVNTFPVDRSVVSRERAGKSYRVLPYYLARFICDMPLRVGQGLLFGAITYWIVGLNPTARAFFLFVTLLVLEGLASQGLGVAVSAACRNDKVAFAVGTALMVILILFGGFYIQKNSIPAWLRWIEYLSLLYWVFMGLTIVDFRGREGWECDAGPAGGKAGASCLTTGEDILARLGFAGNELWEAFLGLCCLILLYNALGYIALRLSEPKFLPLSAPADPSKKTGVQHGDSSSSASGARQQPG